jgi:hypothetical protein
MGLGPSAVLSKNALCEIYYICYIVQQSVRLSPSSFRISLIISQIDNHWFMHKHKLVELQKIIEERIGSLKEEVEIATNVKLNPLYIADRRDETEFLQWIMRNIRSILNRDNERPEQLGADKKRLEIADTIEFESLMIERVQELNLKLKDSNNLREADILINEIDTLESVLGRLSDLKYGDKARAIEIAEANNNFQQANRLRKQLIKIQDIESEISAEIQS